MSYPKLGAVAIAGLVAFAVIGWTFAHSAQPASRTVRAVKPAARSSTPSVRPTHSALENDLIGIAKNFVRMSGDPTVHSFSYVSTRHQAALDLIDAGQISPAEARTPVVLMLMRGHFTASMAHVPPGASFPTGTVLDVTFDPATRRVTDWGLDRRTFDLSSLGPVHTVDFGPS